MRAFVRTWLLKAAAYGALTGAFFAGRAIHFMIG